jgi:hypothetical protein
VAPVLTSLMAEAEALDLISFIAASKSEMAIRRRALAGDRGVTVTVMVCMAEPEPKLSKTCMQFRYISYEDEIRTMHRGCNTFAKRGDVA